MKFSPSKNLEKVIIIMLICMIPISVGLILACFFLPANKAGENSREELNIQPANTEAPALTQKLEFKPDKCAINQPLPDVAFVKENGERLTLKSMEGKVTVLTFWASWCPSCGKELEQSSEIRDMLLKYPEVEYWLVDKTDGLKETKEKALTYLKENKIPLKTVFDEKLQVYGQLGIKTIPTTLVIDSKGILRAWHTGKGMSSGVLESMIEYTVNGGSKGVLDFITRKLTNSQGGIMTVYSKGKEGNTGEFNILSESQGMMMEYAAAKKDKELFDRSFGFVLDQMHKDPLAAWMLTDKGASRVNAVLDDLRIYRALSYANGLWGGYSGRMENYEKALYRYNTQDQFLVDGYDFEHRKKRNQLKLCFADFEALKLLDSVSARWEKVYDNSLAIVENGSIRGNIPLYYSSYDYAKQEYLQDDINMAENMVALLNLARIGRLPQSAVNWLKEAVEGEGIFARYKVDGRVVDGYRYESTAIYGLVVLVASELRDEELADKALMRMEAMRIFDTASPFNGAFGNIDGTGIHSFDQCMALLAYVREEENRR